jgi:hypothetical protein
MNPSTLTRPHPSPLDRIYRLHTPTWQTTPPSCISCGAPILRLDDWLNSECPAAQAREEAA